MGNTTGLVWFGLAVLASFGTQSALAANRFYFEERPLALASTGSEVFVLGEHDFDMAGFSVSIRFDPSDLAIPLVTTDDALDFEPAFFDGRVEGDTVFFGAIFDFLADPEANLPPATGRRLLKIIVDVVGDEPSETVMDLINTTDPPRRNVMTDDTGNSVSPTLTDGVFRLVDGGRFIRGDCNGDGTVTGQVTDAVYLLNYNFLSGPKPRCIAACDADGDGAVGGKVTDAVYLLNYNFLDGPPPPDPFPDCGSVPVPAPDCFELVCP